MYKTIMVPVDLEHVDRLEKALNTTADLAKHYGSAVCFVGVTAETPTAIAHNPDEYQQKLEDFAKKQGEKHGFGASAKSYPSHDPAVEINDKLMSAIDDVGADLVIMASHVPSFEALFFSSHGGSVANHAKCSVFVVR